MLGRLPAAVLSHSFLELPYLVLRIFHEPVGGAVRREESTSLELLPCVSAVPGALWALFHWRLPPLLKGVGITLSISQAGSLGLREAK